jgi:hypothetical protein
MLLSIFFLKKKIFVIEDIVRIIKKYANTLIFKKDIIKRIKI